MARISGLLIWIAAGLSWGTAPAPLAAQEPETVELSLHPAAGASWRKELAVSSIEEGWLGAYEDRSNILRRRRLDSTLVVQTEVLDRTPDGGLELKFAPLRMTEKVSSFTARTGETESEFDTDRVDDPAVPQDLRDHARAFTALSYFATTGPDGTLLDYRVEPLDNPLADKLASALSRALSDGAARFPARRIALGESWTLAPDLAEATILEIGNGRVEYALEAKLLAIESRDGNRHALVRMQAGRASQKKDREDEGPGLGEFEAIAYYEFDLDRGRQIDARFALLVELFALDPMAGDMLHLEQRLDTRERDLDHAGWMIPDFKVTAEGETGGRQ